MPTSLRSGRGGGVWTTTLAIALVLGGVPALGAPEPAPSELPRIALLRPELPAEIAVLEQGLTFWLHEQLSAARAGLLRPPSDAGREAGAPSQEIWRRMAREAGASHLWVTSVGLERGSARLRMAGVEAAGGTVTSLAGGEGPLPELGTQLRDATARVLTGLGLPAGHVTSAPPPSLARLAALSRAIDLLRAGRLAAAQHELAGDPTPAAEALRHRIRQAAEKAGVAQAARVAIADGQVDRAWLELRAALRTREDPGLLLAAAEAAEGRSSPKSALRFYERVARLDPESGEAALGRARLLAETDRGEEARVALERAERLLPDDPRPSEMLAALEEAPVEVRAAAHARAGARSARRLELNRAERHLEKAATLDPSRAGTVQHRLGDVQQLQGHARAAAQTYEKAAAMGEEDPLLWSSLGRVRRGLEDVLGARDAYAEAVARDPGRVEAHVALGEIQLELGEPDAARVHLEKATELAPDDAHARRALAEALHAGGETQRALALLEKPTATRDDEIERLRASARIRAALGERDTARALLGQAVALAPERRELAEELASFESGGKLERRVARARAPASDDPGDGGPVTGSDAPDAFRGLVATFPEAGRVAHLGLVLEREPLERLQDLVWPRVLDVPRLEQALERALAERFELEDRTEPPPQLSPQLEALHAFEADSDGIALVNDVLGVDAVFVGRLAVLAPDEGEPGPPVLALELHMLGGRRAADVSIFANHALLALDLSRQGRPNTVAFGLYGLCALLVGLWLRRGWGSLVVTLDYASTGRGFFSIKLSRRPGKARKGRAKSGSRISPFQQRLRSLGRYERFMVGRETGFRWLPVRTYYVSVYGLLQDPLTEEVIGNYLEEKTARLRRGERLELNFDFRPREAPLEVRVWAEDAAVEQAVVAVKGRADSLKYVREGRLVVPLGPGRHVVRAGFEGRVHEKTVEIRELAGATLHFARHDEASLVFADCPEAVESYLCGDDLAAADLLERAGQLQVAERVRGRHYRDQGELERAAACFEAAGCATEAAEVHEQSGDVVRAAELYQAAGDPRRAARAFDAYDGDRAQPGPAEVDPRRAAQAFEEAYEWDKAIDCYRRAGDTEKVLQLLEKVGDYYEAGVLCLELERGDEAVAALQRVDLRDRRYPRSCELLAEILERRGELELAASKLADAVHASGGEEGAPVAMLARRAALLEAAAQHDEALEAWEGVRRRDLAHPEAAERVAGLKKRAAPAREPATLAEPHAESAPAPAAASRYEILGELGRGGMGVVFKARDRRLDRIVALKRLPENLRSHPTAVKLFLREARAVAALNHPNIVTLFDADQEDGHTFLTMEYLEGSPLNQLLVRHGRLVARDVVRIAAQVCAGLQYAHERRIVHRDVKTANLFFTRARVVKIMDFGLAKMLEEVRRASTVIGGTPFYMAPEQAAGEEVDHRADLYALGVTLFELLAGTVPFSEGDVAYHHRHTPPPDPRERVPDIPGPLAELVLGLLAKDPEGRPESAGLVGRRLQAIGAGLRAPA